jgi:hypothetical protein
MVKLQRHFRGGLMKLRRFKILKKGFSLVLAYLFLCQPIYASIGKHSPTPLFKSQDTGPGLLEKDALRAWDDSPWQFIENRGQTDPSVKFYAKKGSTTVYLTDTAIVSDFIFLRQMTKKNKEIASSEEEAKTHQRQVVKMALKNSNPQPVITGKDKQETIYNYFIGNDPSKWRSEVPSYNEVYYKDVYAGIDLRFYTAGNGGLEYDFIVHPGADPTTIAMSVEGIKNINVSDTGELIMQTACGNISQKMPLIYQVIDGKNINVSGGFNIHRTPVDKDTQLIASGSNHIYGFHISQYDKTKDLIIDPLLASTVIGGMVRDYANAIAVDSSGNVYIGGETTSDDFPVTSGAYDTNSNDSEEGFIVKFDENLKNILSVTYLGGSEEEMINALRITPSGDIYVAGYTSSSNLPVSSTAYDKTYGGTLSDAFVARLDKDLKTLKACTYLGGGNAWYDEFFALTTNSSGDVYVAGRTSASDYPTSSSGYDKTYNGGEIDAVIAKLDANLTTLIGSSFLGGSENDWIYDLAIDSQGNVFAAGKTYSSDMPSTSGAYDTVYDGDDDGFIAKFSGDLKSLLALTYLNGKTKGEDEIYGIIVDNSGNIFVTGSTSSKDFPTTSGAYDRVYKSGGADVFVSKFSSDLKTLKASTFLGGGQDDCGRDIQIDGSGNIWITGWVYNPYDTGDFPVTSDAYDKTFNGGHKDAFIARFDAGLSSLLYSSLIGGSNEEEAYSIALSPAGKQYITGYTKSTDFPVTADTYHLSDMAAKAVRGVAFVSKFGIAGGETTPVAPSSLTGIAKSSTQIVLGWKDNSSNEAGFKIERMIGDCNSSNPWVQVAAISANMTTITLSSGLSADTTYSFRIRAYNGSTYSAYSNCVSVKTGATGTPPSPTNFRSTSVSSSKINLNWTDNSTNETGFKIYRKAALSSWMLRATTGANATSFSDTTASNNSLTTTYQYYMVSYNSSGNSPATYTATVPYQPASLTASQGSSAGSIQLTWMDRSSNESGFEIYRKDGTCASTNTWAKVATVAANKTTWTDSGRTSGSTYSYKIRAYKKSGAVLSAYGYSLWSLCDDATAP